MMDIEEIKVAVAKHYGIRVEAMTINQRGMAVCWPRMVAMYLIREITKASYPVIGRAFNKHHTTVMNAVDRVSDIILLNEDIAYDIHRMKDSWNNIAGNHDKSGRDLGAS